MTINDIRADIAHLLDDPVDDIAPDANLVDHGLDSMRVMELADLWAHRTGHEVRFADLAERPTLQAWADIVGRQV